MTVDSQMGDMEDEAEKKKPIEESPEEKFSRIYKDGNYFLLPSFYKTLCFLSKTKRDFSIVFRSMGREIPDALWDFNNFCEGNHPAWSGKAGTRHIKYDGSTK